MNSNWPTKKLGEVIELTKRERVGDEQETPILSITMGLGLVDQSEKFKERVASRDISNYKKVKKNELVIGFPIDEGVLGFQKKYNYAAVSPAYSVWKIKDGNADMYFLEYFMRSDFARNLYRSRMVWTTERRRFIPKRQFLSIPVPFPKKQVQTQIVERLDKIAEAQELNNELIQKSDELFQSLLHQELNPVGKDWEVKKLVEILKPQYGYTEAAKEAGNYRFIRITDIGDDGELRDSDKKYVTISPNEAENYQLRNGDLLLARTGATFGKILYFKENEPSIFASFLIRLNPNTSIDPFYIWLFSRSQSYWRQAKSLMTGSGQPQFNANKLKQIKIPLPPLTTQKQIVAKLSAVQEYKNQLLSQKTKLKELFDSVLHKSMNGELIN